MSDPVPWDDSTIRPATPTDVPGMFALSANAPQAAQWTEARYRDIFNPASPRRLAWVIERENAIQGFIAGLCVGPEWEIENIVIAPAWLRRGLGSALLKNFLEFAQKSGAESVLLEVRESNHAARSLYEKLGFRASGIRPDYYRQPTENAVTYRHNIPGPSC